MATAYINIGSNTGESRRTLWRAVIALLDVAADRRVVCSDIVVSEPWGYISDRPYLNIGVLLDTDLEPHALLHATQDIERRLGATPHRDATGAYIDRNLDIDIIDIDNIRVDTSDLTLPHPRARLRPFVLEPLRQLLPGHPLLRPAP